MQNQKNDSRNDLGNNNNKDNNESNPVISRIKNQISKNPVLLYMKGSPQFPMCGFSARVAHILNNHSTEYVYVNILENPDIRSTLPIYANWPTFPQLYIEGELIGGCDIVSELEANRELEPLLRKADAIKAENPKIVEAS